MITYSVAQVEALTGIKAHTLRIWERRYDFLEPNRTPTNIRYYSDEQLKKLLNFGILVRNGYRVSKLNKMGADEIFEAVSKVLSEPNSETSDEMRGLTLSMLEMNEEGFDDIFERQVIRRGFSKTIIEVIYPFLQYVGVLWTTNKAMVAQEHFISNLIRQKIVAATERLSMPSKEAPSLVLFLLEGEEHEIGLLLAGFIAKSMGWRVYYLGQSIPVINIKKVIEIVEPELMMTMFVTPKVNKIRGYIEELLEDGTSPLLVSGSAENMEVVSVSERVVKISSPDHFERYLADVQKASGTTA